MVVLETPHVCSSIMRVEDECRELELKGIEMLGILIGGDHYWDIVSGKVEWLSESLAALDSKFGWLIQGTVSMLTVTTDAKTTNIKIGIEE